MRIHFVGIGGIGVSALAKYYLQSGHKISGSDLIASEITDSLKKMGVKIKIGPHKRGNISQEVDLVIYSAAVNKKNPELLQAIRYKLKAKSYPQALGDLTREYWTIAVSGSHGKSTTSAMLALLLIEAGFDPTVIIGTKLKEFGNSNCRVGKSKYLVIEADEHFASFLNYWPKIIVLTNIEREHLDFYKNLKNIVKTYKKYILHLPENGILVLNKDDKNILNLKSQILNLKSGITKFSLKQPEAKILKKLLKIPGEHNVANGLAALAAARALKIPDEISFQALSKYKGSWRRFEITKALHPKPYILISDYGHHPTEIRVTLKAAREKYPKKKIWCVFQPHQYQRTYYLFDEFVKVFRQAPIDKLIIADIYDVAGREEKLVSQKVSSAKLIKAIRNERAIYIPKMGEIIDYLKKNLKGGEVVLIMGAGDIYDLVLCLKKL